MEAGVKCQKSILILILILIKMGIVVSKEGNFLLIKVGGFMRFEMLPCILTRLAVSDQFSARKLVGKSSKILQF